MEITDRISKLFQEHKKGSRFKNNLNVTAFKKYLKGALNPNVDFKFIKDGFPLYLITDGTQYKPIALSQKTANMARTKREFIKIIDQFIKELQGGAIEPSKYPPKYVINVFCVPKKDSTTGIMTKLRVVRYGSFSEANTTSIDD